MRSFLVLVIVFVFCPVCFALTDGPEGYEFGFDENPKIIVSVTGGRVRSEPDLRSEILGQMTIGTLLPLLGEKGGWYKVSLPADNEKENEKEATKTGWISKTISLKFDDAKRGMIYRQITDKYFSRSSLSFNTARELFEFLPRAADQARTFELGGDLRLKHLLALSAALKAIPFNKDGQSPYKEFLAKNKDDIVFSEPAGEYYVFAKRFWELHEKYRKYSIGEKIAWEATKIPLPGECEGYINCYLFHLRVTSGEYLNFYPAGTHSKQALLDMNNLFQPIVADLGTKTTYYTTSDISDRAEFNRFLAELRKIISKTPHIEKQEILKQIDQIAEGHR